MKLQLSEIELTNGLKFWIKSNLKDEGLDLNDALDSWVLRTEEYTALSFINYLKSKPNIKAVLVDALVMQGVSQPVFACAADRDLFIKNAGTWMDRDEFRTCKNCKNWQASLPTTIIACCDEANIATDGNFGCNRFASKQTA